MKRLVSLLLCIFLVVVAYAQQGDRLVDSMGNLVYQYNRSATYLEPGKCKVTVTIVNGNKQLGVSFRQEVFRSQLQWQETVGGDTTEMPNIKVITANLKPNETVAWTFVYQNKSAKKDRSIDLEKSCFMLLNDEYLVTKKVLPETVIKLAN
jgi:hypothetical protein